MVAMALLVLAGLALRRWIAAGCPSGRCALCLWPKPFNPDPLCPVCAHYFAPAAEFVVRYEGPKVAAGGVTFSDLERAVGGAMAAVTRAAAILAAGATCEAVAVTRPAVGEIRIGFTIRRGDERDLGAERLVVRSLASRAQKSAAGETGGA